MTARAFITGLAGTALTPAERLFLRESDPWGLIVFKRNIASPDQVRGLTASFRETVGRDAPVLVDQEGGRVQRLGPPHWRVYPAGADYGRIYDENAATGMKAAYLGARLIAADLVAVGIDVDCLPIADVPVAEAQRRISVYSLDGELLSRWGEKGTSPGQFSDSPHGVCVDSHGDLYVCEVISQGRLQKFARQ